MHRLLAALLFVLGTLLLAATPASARADSFSPAQRAEIVEIVRQALKSDPSLLREAIVALQADDERADADAAQNAIKAAGSALAHDSADPSEGNPQGDVTVVEFFDPRCPYCRRMLPTVANLLKRDPRLRIVYKDIPILGPGSLLGSKALLAAQKQGGYLKMREAVLTGPAEITLDTLHASATKAGLDWGRMSREMNDADIADRLRVNLALAHKLNIQGTPAYVIGAQMYSGAMTESDMVEAIAKARKAN